MIVEKDHFRMDLDMFPQFLILFPYGKIGGLHPVRGWFGSELPIDQFFANAHPEPGLVLSCCNLLAQIVKHRPWLGPGTSGDTDAAIRPCLIPDPVTGLRLYLPFLYTSNNYLTAAGNSPTRAVFGTDFTVRAELINAYINRRVKCQRKIGGDCSQFQTWTQFLGY